MKHYNFKLYEESDPDIIGRLDSLTRRERSGEIRRALRAYFRGQITPKVQPTGEAVLNQVDDSLFDKEPVIIDVPNEEEVIKDNLQKLKDMF